jgi:hypothetical protein
MKVKGYMYPQMKKPVGMLVLGTHLFTVEIYVAPIEEDMLLGLDFLEANGVSLNQAKHWVITPIVQCSRY